MNKKHYFLGAIVFLVLITLGVALILNKKQLFQPTSESQYTVNNRSSQYKVNNSQKEPVKPPVQVGFLEKEINLNKSQQHTSILSFTSLPEPTPTAFTLILTFDPSILQVDNIEPGNLWSGENVLQKDIDNERGVVLFSVGQGFNDEITGESQIAKITFTSESADTQIEIDPKSVYTSVKEKLLVPMQGLPLTITVK